MYLYKVICVLGMGKTVELISIILGNPSKSSDVTSKGQIYSRATLIVVPPILSSQWWRELHDRVIPGTLKCMNLTNRMLSREMEILDVSLSNMRFPSQGLNSWGDKRAIRFMAVGMTAEARFSWAPKVHVPVTIVSYSCLDDVIHRVKVKFTVRDLIHDNDVVITTYEWFRRHSAAYRRIHWHRVVLDECQQVKASSSDVAIDCANLDATYRWMVSGTPFVNSIADLHGELQFLRVWPFCLPDNEDGFWEKKIGIPFRHRDKNSLVLLHALIQAVMIRHSKSQCTLNGEALVKIPHRIVEWRAFEVTNSSELFIYKYIESFTAEAFQILLNNNRMHLRNPELLKMSTFINIRSLLTFMSQCLTHPGVLDLKKLDNIRRRLVGLQLHEYDDEDKEICLESHGVLKVKGRRNVYIHNRDVNNFFVQMSAGHALQHVQALGQGVAGGMNRESHRKLGNIVVSEMESRLTEKYKLLDVAALQAEVQRLDLPLPMIWQTLKCKADIDRGSVNMKCYPSDKSIKVILFVCVLFNLYRMYRLICIIKGSQGEGS
jgi:SNF2 family DNA or RNA helicase